MQFLFHAALEELMEQDKVTEELAKNIMKQFDAVCSCFLLAYARNL